MVDAIQRLIAGEDLGRELIHPAESCFDAEGGIVFTLDGLLSEKAADKIGERLY